MAIRRCFSKKIVRSDDFLDLPVSTQLLYFQLGMEADDRGYINNARSVIKITGCGVGDLEMLIAKRFVLVRQEKLILIKGWRINNSIQPTRVCESQYVDDLKLLFFDERGSYTERETNLPVSKIICRQDDDKVSTQVNLIEDNLIKDNLTKDNDLTRLNEIKANPFAKELVNKLIDCKYININCLQLRDYLNYFESLLDEGKKVVDVKVKLDYFIRIVCHYLPTGEKDYQDKPIFKLIYTDDRKIQDKYVYFVSAMDKAFENVDIDSSDTIEEPKDDLGNTYTSPEESHDLDSVEVNDDDLPF